MITFVLTPVSGRHAPQAHPQAHAFFWSATRFRQGVPRKQKKALNRLMNQKKVSGWSLSFAHGLSYGMPALCLMLSKHQNTITRLSISDLVCSQDTQARDLLSLLQSLPCLTHLTIENSYLGDQGCIALGLALSGRTHLHELRLEMIRVSSYSLYLASKIAQTSIHVLTVNVLGDRGFIKRLLHLSQEGQALPYRKIVFLCRNESDWFELMGTLRNASHAHTLTVAAFFAFSNEVVKTQGKQALFHACLSHPRLKKVEVMGMSLNHDDLTQELRQALDADIRLKFEVESGNAIDWFEAHKQRNQAWHSGTAQQIQEALLRYKQTSHNDGWAPPRRTLHNLQAQCVLALAQHVEGQQRKAFLPLLDVASRNALSSQHVRACARLFHTNDQQHEQPDWDAARVPPPHVSPPRSRWGFRRPKP